MDPNTTDNPDALRAIIWRLIKQQGGRMAFDLTPPPSGFWIRTVEGPAGASYLILCAEES